MHLFGIICLFVIITGFSELVLAQESNRITTTDPVTQLKEKGTNKSNTNDFNKPKNTNTRSYAPPRKTGTWLFNMPPFLVGACSVLVLYGFFHCLYMHCYTEKKVKSIANRAAKTPTIIINDDPSAGSVQNFTPLVKYEAPYGKTEVVEAQPFLICQPLDNDVTAPRDHTKRRKSIQLHVPKLFNKFRRESKSPSYCSTDSQSEGAENGPLNAERNKQTRASICFVPIGKSIQDPVNNGMDWMPLHGFVYSSFVLPRRPSYKQACTSNESVSTSKATSEQSLDTPVMIFPSRTSFVRSISQPCEAISAQNNDADTKIRVPSEIEIKAKECALDDKLSPSQIPVRKNSKVSFYEPESSYEQ